MNDNNAIVIRRATPDDASALLKIYEPYVLNTAVSFEYDVPSVGEFARRIENTQQRYPYLTAEIGGIIVGYAYAGCFKNRAAYDRSAEVSIYVRQDMKRQGIGKRLYCELERMLSEMNILNLYACIAVPVTEDKYLTRDSVQFHTHLGYKTVGEFHKCGCKFGRWYDMIWMEKIIGRHTDSPTAVRFEEHIEATV